MPGTNPACVLTISLERHFSSWWPEKRYFFNYIRVSLSVLTDNEVASLLVQGGLIISTCMDSESMRGGGSRHWYVGLMY